MRKINLDDPSKPMWIVQIIFIGLNWKIQWETWGCLESQFFLSHGICWCRALYQRQEHHSSNENFFIGLGIETVLPMIAYIFTVPGLWKVVQWKLSWIISDIDES